jgi:hypothetical protein
LWKRQRYGGREIVGAREPNAGDDFHFWWAAYRALALVAPGTDLRLLTLERLARVDDPDEAYETVDVAEYFGGCDVASARARHCPLRTAGQPRQSRQWERWWLNVTTGR